MRSLPWLACLAFLAACTPQSGAPTMAPEASQLPTGRDNTPCFENQKAVNGKCVAQDSGGG